MKFAELLKNLRVQKRLTLRDCATALQFDHSNWSKVERGIMPAPKDIETLERWAEFFGLTGEPKQNFFDLAALSRQQIPGDIASDELLMAKLPAFFRMIRGQELDGKKFQQFVADLRRLHSAGETSLE